jgi:hypothetical protein
MAQVGKTLALIIDDWHIWDGLSGDILVSAPDHALRTFPTTDDAINWLYLSDHKPVARRLHHAVKEMSLG